MSDPTIRAMLEDIRDRYGKARIDEDGPLTPDNVWPIRKTFAPWVRAGHPMPADDGPQAELTARLAKISADDVMSDSLVKLGSWAIAEGVGAVLVLCWLLWSADPRPLIAYVACSIVNMQQGSHANDLNRAKGWLAARRGVTLEDAMLEHHEKPNASD